MSSEQENRGIDADGRSSWGEVRTGVDRFCERNWILVLVLFFGLLAVWWVYCLPGLLAPRPPCPHEKSLQARLERINMELDRCCECRMGGPIQTNQCDVTESVSGRKIERFVSQHEMGSTPGWVTINYDMQEIPDLMDVYHAGKLMTSTGGMASGTGILKWYYDPLPGTPTQCTVVVRAPHEGTAWSYHISCPQ